MSKQHRMEVTTRVKANRKRGIHCYITPETDVLLTKLQEYCHKELGYFPNLSEMIDVALREYLLKKIQGLDIATKN